MNPEDSKLMERAAQTGKLTSEQIREIKKAQAESGSQRASEIIVEKGYLSADEVARLLDKGARPDTRFYDVPPDVAEARDNPDNHVGKYVKIREIGRGGFGSIWVAWDTNLRRRVAIKFLSTDDPENVERFKREARTAARLSHQNIVQIYEIAETERPPFIVMEFIDGKDLTELKLPVPEAVGAVRDAARGVAAAHKEGVVHRDIKPHNLMRTQTGRVCVMDFGLARQVKPGSSVTMTGVILGTPPYMSPEQAMGETRTDSRIDVYGLGATLYELLTDQPPFLGATPIETLRMVVDREPMPPRRLNRNIPLDLETIVLKCLEKDPDRRYATASDLADDLDRFLQGEAIAARRASIAYRMSKFVRRNRPMVVMSCLLVLATALGLTGWYFNYRQKRDSGKAGLSAEVEGLTKKATEAITDWDLKLAQKKQDITGSRSGLIGALSTIDAALPRFPKVHELHYQKARILQRLGRHEEAIAVLDAAIKLAPQQPDYYFDRARGRMALYQRTTSIHKMLGRLSFLISGDTPERLKKERADLMAGACADFESARGRKLPGPGRDRFAEAMIAWAKNDAARAKTILGALVEDPQLNAEALKAHGDILAEGRSQAEYDESRKMYLDAIDIRRCYGEAYAALGDLELSRIGPLTMINAGAFKKATDEAIARFDAALEIDRGFAPALAGRALARFLTAFRNYAYWEPCGAELSRALTDDCGPLIELEPLNYMAHGLRGFVNSLLALEQWDGRAWTEGTVRDAERDLAEGSRLSVGGQNATLAGFHGLLLAIGGRYKDAAARFDVVGKGTTIFGNAASDWARACRNVDFGATAQGSLELMRLAGDPTKQVTSILIESIGTSPFNRMALAVYDRAFRNLVGEPLNEAQKKMVESEYRHYLGLLTVAARNERGKPAAAALAATVLDAATPILGERAVDILLYSQYKDLNRLEELKPLLER